MAHRGGADDRAARRLELADGRRVEGVDRGDGRTVEGREQFAPFAHRNNRACGKAHRLQHAADGNGIDREHFTEQRDGRQGAARGARCRNGALADFLCGVAQHGARQHVLGFRVGGNAEARHIDADDAHPVDLLRQQLQRHAGSRGNAEIGDDDGVVVLGLGEVEHRLADVLEQLARHQSLGIEGHVANAAARAIEVRGEGQAIDAAGRARKDRRGAAHAQANAQRSESGAHALRLVMRAQRIITRILLEDLALARGGCGLGELFLACMAGHAGGIRRLGRRFRSGSRPVDEGGCHVAYTAS